MPESTPHHARVMSIAIAVAVLVASGCGGRKAQLEPLETSTTDPEDGTTDPEGEASVTSTTPTETDTGTDTNTGPDTDPTDWGTDFVPPSEDGWGDSWCDPFAQDCPEGEKCVPYESSGQVYDSNKCVPIFGDQTTGDACLYSGPIEATDDCDGDNVCWYTQEIDGELLGTCVPLCDGTADDPLCPDGTTCYIANSTSVTLCLPACDPLAQDCEIDQGCYWSGSVFVCLSTTDDVPVGGPCDAYDDCASGLICLAADVIPSCDSAACCSPFCDLQAGDGPCAAVPGTVCSMFFEMNMAPPGFEQLGVCIAP